MNLRLRERLRPDVAFIATVLILGSAVASAALIVDGVRHPLALIPLVLVTAVAERLFVRLYFDGRISMTFMASVFAAIFFGPGATAVVSTTTALAMWWSDRSGRKLLFNFGQLNLAGAAAAMSALSVLAISDNAGMLVLAGAAAATARWAVSSAAVANIIAITSSRTARDVHRDNFRWMLPHYAGLGAVSGGLVEAYRELGLVGLLVLCVPLLLSRYAMKQVIEKTRENVIQLEETNHDLRVAHVEISSMSKRIQRAYDETLESLVTALDLRDRETRGHSVRVATHSLELAKLLGIKDPEELDMVYRGALMHDVGKIGVPDGILLKPGKLTEEEWEFMRRHSAMGYRILAQVPYLRPAAKVVLAHHERWDGDGYPRKLKGENIPLGARIFAISDTYDAIISDRPYRQGQSPDAAFAEILKCAGSQFDPRVIEAFEAVFPSWREESNGQQPAIYLPSYIERQDETKRQAS